jgi:hypothetical protein
LCAKVCAPGHKTLRITLPMRQPEPPSTHVTRDNFKNGCNGWVAVSQVSGDCEFQTGYLPAETGTNTESLVFFEVDAKALGHAVESSAVDAEDLSGLTSMMFGDFENVKEVAAF